MNRKRIIKWSAVAVVFPAMVWYFFSLPDPLFDAPYSTVLLDREGKLLTASVARDDQWRFPEIDRVPEKIAKCMVVYEDKRFWYHPGIDVLAIGRAIRQNVSTGKVVSGGSTISMQVIRLSRRDKPRTFTEKIVEGILSTRLELRYSKEEILALYASHAPFGGNTVGLEAACWRYFNRPPEQLSWAEAATLAVLPNSPALIHPGRNREALEEKRNFLLRRLNAVGVIDSLSTVLAMAEPLPDEPYPIPRTARHLLQRVAKSSFDQQRVTSTISGALQLQVESVVRRHQENLTANRIFNAAAIIAEVETGNVLAYVGNVSPNGRSRDEEVDVIVAPRSTGSILKPFLYAAMLDEGKLLPSMLVPDVPTVIDGFAPKNFSHQYDGAVPADQALIRSLNVPAVHELRDYRYERFHDLLSRLGMKTLTHAPDHYGLSLILGGAEGSLWDITGMYASLARTLNHYFQYPGKQRYRKSDIHSLTFFSHSSEQETPLTGSSVINASSIYLAFEAMKELYRPGEESGWKHFDSSAPIAWKTGTSFGFRDGWAVGVTPSYVVGVWVGNADGEGRPGLTGTETAAPILFDLFGLLGSGTWFTAPLGEMEEVLVCPASGHRATGWCPGQVKRWIPRSGLSTEMCPYHVLVHLSSDRKYRVYSDCEDIARQIHEPWFVLPPVQEYYYRTKNLSYKSLPPYRADCGATPLAESMDLIYPGPNARIFIPRELDGKSGSSIFELAHRRPGTIVYWHLDGRFVGSTTSVHQLGINAEKGHHTIQVIDQYGEVLTRTFEVLSGT